MPEHLNVQYFPFKLPHFWVLKNYADVQLKNQCGGQMMVKFFRTIAMAGWDRFGVSRRVTMQLLYHKTHWLFCINFLLPSHFIVHQNFHHQSNVVGKRRGPFCWTSQLIHNLIQENCNQRCIPNATFLFLPPTTATNGHDEGIVKEEKRKIIDKKCNIVLFEILAIRDPNISLKIFKYHRSLCQEGTTQRLSPRSRKIVINHQII